MICPHCASQLVEHLTGASKQGAQHCHGCGCCFQKDGKTLREGITACEFSPPAVETEADEADPDPVVEETRPTGRRR